MNKLVKFTDINGKAFAVPSEAITVTESGTAEQGQAVIHARGQAFYVNESVDDVIALLVGEKPKAKKDEKAEVKAGDYPTDEEAKANAAARKAAEAQKAEAAAKDKADHKPHAKAHA